MRRRLNLGCALVSRPRLVLLDEPTVAVDPQSRAHIFDAVRTLRARGTTILYTTHYLEEAENLCDRIAIMDEGQIVALRDACRAAVALARDRGDRAPPARAAHHASRRSKRVEGVQKVGERRQRWSASSRRARSTCCRGCIAPCRPRPRHRPDPRHPGHARRRLPRADRKGAAGLMTRGAPAPGSRRRWPARSPGPLAAASAAEPARARMALDARRVSSRSNAIVTRQGDRKQKLTALSDAPARLPRHGRARAARGGKAPRRAKPRAETQEFLTLFRELFVRTYVQRLLLFDAPDFAYGAEKVTGDTGTGGDRDRHAGTTVRGRLHAARADPDGWRVDRHRGRGA